MNLNTETKRKLREMAAGDLLTAFESQDDVVSMSLSIEARIELAVDPGFWTRSHRTHRKIPEKSGIFFVKPLLIHTQIR